MVVLYLVLPPRPLIFDRGTVALVFVVGSTHQYAVLAHGWVEVLPAMLLASNFTDVIPAVLWELVKTKRLNPHSHALWLTSKENRVRIAVHSRASLSAEACVLPAVPSPASTRGDRPCQGKKCVEVRCGITRPHLRNRLGPLSIPCAAPCHVHADRLTGHVSGLPHCFPLPHPSLKSIACGLSCHNLIASPSCPCPSVM